VSIDTSSAYVECGDFCGGSSHRFRLVSERKVTQAIPPGNTDTVTVDDLVRLVSEVWTCNYRRI
jgi:hypothetical protein